ncbi:uncharacterized protein LOC129583028 isoform X2 [Paramacrobiotus metropolitanus]|uniref:uncharacterized protein LOC129583028 isoform X2 n=1 Tax=Paramacrobiotus metropolitanus TaxID=2943436 RepID=UPI0024458192|nr:uncharacterized protein LOC129583028 isoform X2 [Paramacrobiotus metropolitanus]XP_055330853.1 uncharacterized protein LOC129583028 isoform X2 [Paramacrobiotus metropolitanus]
MLKSVRKSVGMQIFDSLGELAVPSREMLQQKLEKMEEIEKRLAVDEYRRILRTYTSRNDSELPWPLTPVELALQGWEFYQPGIVRCTHCQRTCFFDAYSYKEIFTGVSPVDQTMRTKITDDFRQQIVDSGHDMLCRRPVLPRESEVNQFVLFSFKSFREMFEKRLRSLVECGGKLPVIAKDYHKLLPEEILQKAVLKLLGKEYEFSVLLAAAYLALFGWLADEEARGTPPLLACRECDKRVSCAGFCPLERLAILEANEEEGFHPDLFSAGPEGQFRFDCQGEHFSWCPWVRIVPVPTERLEALALPLNTQLTGSQLIICAFKKEYLTM